jgi:hypothetical protein
MATAAGPAEQALQAPRAISYGWLRGAPFDLTFVAGVATFAIAVSLLVVRQPRLFPLVLVIDMWLLGFHHVVSTFTRLAFDKESFRAHRFLVLGLPPLVLAGVVGLVFAFGTWILPTIYLYWQWFHYTRQSYGIAQIYRRKSGGVADEPRWLGKAMIYLLPLWGILHRSQQHPATFLRQPIKVLPVPLALVQAAALATMITIAWWLVRQVRAAGEGRLPVAYCLYILSHVVIFTVGYLSIEDISYGWLTINIWHNAQYILLVWMYNNNRFKGGVDPRHRFLSTLSQRNRVVLYFLVCLGISTVFYLALDGAFGAVGLGGRFSILTLTLAAYQAINFHHYIVDGVIWKVRKKRLQENLGLAS